MIRDVEIIAFIYTGRSSKINVFQALMGFEIARRTATSFEITLAGNRLPDDFFSDRVSSIAAVVGKNSSGKSTMLEDVFKILCGSKPLCSEYALVLRAGGELMQIAHGNIHVTYNGQAIRFCSQGQNFDTRVLYYSSTYDPFSRRGPLARDDGSVSAVDISNQAIYSTNLISKDFDCKIRYLQHISHQRRASFELQPDGAFSRTISFKATVGYDSQQTFKRLAEVLVTVLNGKLQPILARHLTSAHAVEGIDLASAVSQRIIFEDERTSFLSDWNDVDYFELVVNFLKRDCGQVGLIDDSFAFELAIGRCIDLAFDPNRQGRHNAKQDLSGLVEDCDTALIGILGADQFSHVNGLSALYTHLSGRTTARDEALQIDIEEITDGIDQRANAFLESLLRLRAASFDFVFEFTGISEGQRSLLTFFSRFYVRETAENHESGNVVLIIDEHELGLHPEWQRKYIFELISFLNREARTTGRVQVMLSSHSPFVVSDLPRCLVNVVGEQKGHSDTFAANLLELLLSPVFMNRTTGEFAADKLKMLVKRMRDPDSVLSMPELESQIAPVIREVADTVLKNYLAIEYGDAKKKVGATT